MSYYTSSNNLTTTINTDSTSITENAESSNFHMPQASQRISLIDTSNSKRIFKKKKSSRAISLNQNDNNSLKHSNYDQNPEISFRYPTFQSTSDYSHAEVYAPYGNIFVNHDIKSSNVRFDNTTLNHYGLFSRTEYYPLDDKSSIKANDQFMTDRASFLSANNLDYIQNQHISLISEHYPGIPHNETIDFSMVSTKSPYFHQRPDINGLFIESANSSMTTTTNLYPEPKCLLNEELCHDENKSKHKQDVYANDFVSINNTNKIEKMNIENMILELKIKDQEININKAMIKLLESELAYLKCSEPEKLQSYQYELHVIRTNMIESYETQILAMKKEINKLQKENQNLVIELDSMNKITNMNTKDRPLLDIKGVLVQQYDKEIYEKNHESLMIEKSKLMNRINELENKNSKLVESLSEQDLAIKKLEKAISLTQTDEKEFHYMLNQMQQDIENLQNTLAVKNSKIRELEVENQSLLSRIETLNQQIHLYTVEREKFNGAEEMIIERERLIQVSERLKAENQKLLYQLFDTTKQNVEQSHQKFTLTLQKFQKNYLKLEGRINDLQQENTKLHQLQLQKDQNYDKLKLESKENEEHYKLKFSQIESNTNELRMKAAAYDQLEISIKNIQSSLIAKEKELTQKANLLITTKRQLKYTVAENSRLLCVLKEMDDLIASQNVRIKIIGQVQDEAHDYGYKYRLCQKELDRVMCLLDEREKENEYLKNKENHVVVPIISHIKDFWHNIDNIIEPKIINFYVENFETFVREAFSIMIFIFCIFVIYLLDFDLLKH